MVKEFWKLLKAREELTKWGEAYREAKTNGLANPKIEIHPESIGVSFQSIDGSSQFEPQKLISERVVNLVAQDAEALVEKAFHKAMAEISDELAKLRPELQKLLDSV